MSLSRWDAKILRETYLFVSLWSANDTFGREITCVTSKQVIECQNIWGMLKWAMINTIIYNMSFARNVIKWCCLLYVLMWALDIPDSVDIHHHIPLLEIDHWRFSKDFFLYQQFMNYAGIHKRVCKKKQSQLGRREMDSSIYSSV